MTTYISLIRAINVGAKKPMRMRELVALYQSQGFKNVRTYIQSGNVIFDSPPTPVKELSNAIEAGIVQALKYEVALLTRTLDELEQIVKGNPFLKEKDIDVNWLYVTFLSDAPGKQAQGEMKEMRDESDRFIVLNKEAYLYCPNGYGRTMFQIDFFERKLGVTATTRNWRTVNALLLKAKNQSDGF